jgi:hypothetical protein
MSAAIAEHAGEIGRGASAIKSGAANVLRFGLAALPLYPAVRINLDAAAGQGETWAAVGIGFVLFGALAIEHSLHAVRWRQAVTALLWGVLGAGFLALNGMNAIANLASHTDHSRDENRAKMQTAAELSRQRDELTERRREQTKLAGEATPDSIEAEIQASKAANSSLWRASQSCDASSITRDITRAFCKSLADLEAKKAAATKRDDIDGKLAKLDEKAEAKGEAPSTVDSFADAMADGLTAFGYKVSEKDKLAIVRVRDWSKAIGVEVLAAFGPAALLGLLLRGSSAPSPYEVRKAQKAADKARKARELEEEEERRRASASRRAAELEAKAAADAEAKAKVDRAAKRAEAKTREKGDPETVGKWLNEGGVVQVAGNIILLSAAHEKYDAYCRARGEKPVSKGRDFGAELRKLGIEVRERAKRTEVVGLAIFSASKPANRGGLRIAFSR